MVCFFSPTHRLEDVDIQEQVDRQEGIDKWLVGAVCPVRQEAGEVYRQEAGWTCPVCCPGGDDGGENGLHLLLPALDTHMLEEL